MSDISNEREPTMEEILASIRRIISEDNAERSGLPDTPGAQEDDSGELVLTDMVSDDGSVVTLSEEAPDIEPEPLRSIHEPRAPVEMPRAAPSIAEPESAAPPPRRQAETMRKESELDTLLTEAAAAQSSAALAQLTSAFPRRHDPGYGGRTVEEVVREAVAPMLRDWLDANLAIIVERLVRKEIERLVREVEENARGS